MAATDGVATSAMIAGDLQPRELVKRWLKESIALGGGLFTNK
jgi:hypothetical protein